MTEKYNPKYKKNQLIYGNGKYVVGVTGWSDRKYISTKLDPTSYAALGQLYSPHNGLSFLVRNLLYNPQIHTVVTLNCTLQDKKSGSLQALKDFFLNGVNLNAIHPTQLWVVDSKIESFIDKEIPYDSLLLLMKRIRFIETNDVLHFSEVLKANEKPRKNYKVGKPLSFPEPVVKSKQLPGYVYGHIVRGETVSEVWVKLLAKIRKYGIKRPTGYDGELQEVINLMGIISHEPFTFSVPNYLPVTPKGVEEYLPQILDDMPYKEGVKYTYSQRLRSWFGKDQIEQVIYKLKKEKDSASAVMSLWDAGSGTHKYKYGPLDKFVNSIRRFGRDWSDSDHDHGGSPCLNHIWTKITNDSLSMTCLFRSHDMFSAYCSNMFGLRALQKHIYDVLRETYSDLKIGNLISISESAHIYDHSWGYADEVIKEQLKKINTISYDDPCGNFLIEFSSSTSRIVVKQLDRTTGQIVREYSNKNPLLLIRIIGQENPDIDPIHMGYLGMEIYKCKIQGEHYEQDK